MKKTVIYNFMFPLWAVYVFPPFLLVTIPVNIAIDFLAVWLAQKLLKINLPENFLYHNLWKIVLIGYLSDLVGVAFISIFSTLFNFIGLELSYGTWGWSDPLYFLLRIMAILIAAWCIYYLNHRFLPKTAFTVVDRKKLLLCLALFTAPYLFLI